MAVARPRDPATADRHRIAGLLELGRQFVFIAAAVVLYFGVRGRTQGDAEKAVLSGLEVLAFERSLGLDLERWAQGLIIEHAWLVTSANWIYIWGHWPLIAVTLVWLHRADRREFLLIRNAMFISGAIGLVIFATYAVAPPRLVDNDFLDTVTQRSDAYRILQPPSLVNKYAAIPSLHVGWNLLVGIAWYRVARSDLGRVFGIVSPILMAIAVVVTANHYVIDGLLGSALALFGLALSHLITPRIVELDARIRERLQHRRVVDDQAGDAEGNETLRGSDVVDGPREHRPVTAPEIVDEPRREQSAVDDDSVEFDSRR